MFQNMEKDRQTFFFIHLLCTLHVQGCFSNFTSYHHPLLISSFIVFVMCHNYVWVLKGICHLRCGSYISVLQIQGLSLFRISLYLIVPIKFFIKDVEVLLHLQNLILMVQASIGSTLEIFFEGESTLEILGAVAPHKFLFEYQFFKKFMFSMKN